MTRDDPRTWRELWQRSAPYRRRNLLIIIGGAVLAVLIVLAVVAPLIALLL